MHSARNLVRDVTGEYDSEAETALGQDTPFAKLDVSAVATRLFAAIRELDALAVTQIVTSEPHGAGVAAAVAGVVSRIIL